MGFERTLEIGKDSSTVSDPKPKSEAIGFVEAKRNANRGIERPKVETAPLNEVILNRVYNQDPPKRMGLHNFSNACYQLAVIQCLDTVQALVDHLRAQRSRVILDTRLTGLGEDSLLQVARSKKAKHIKKTFKSSKALM